MQFFIKLALSMTVIVLCAQIGKRYPTLGGLIATMPLTSLIVLLWLYTDDPGNADLMIQYTKGVLWGIFPSILFFLVTFLCFSKHLPLSTVLLAGFGAWLVGAVLHQWLLG